MALVGYLIRTKTGVARDLGTMYNYILAANGVFIQAENDHLWAMLPVSGLTVPADWPHTVRGLLPLEPGLVLKHGLVPAWTWLQVRELLLTLQCESLVVLRWRDGHYVAQMPPQVGKRGSVQYEPEPGTIIQVHSHPENMLFFSQTDDDDELGLGVYGVACKMADGTFQSQWRVGIYGHFCPVPASKIFEGGEAHVPTGLRGPV